MKAKEETSRPARMSDEAVRTRTGKTWAEWFAALDAAGAAELDHKAIVEILARDFHLDPWWQQMVTVAYEQERGKRVLYQTTHGYQVSRSKTLAVPVEKLYAAFADAALRGRWLPDVVFDIHSQTPNKVIHLAWDDGSQVEARFTPRGAGRCQVTVQHNKLKDPGEAERMKAYWGDALGRLSGAVEAGGD